MQIPDFKLNSNKHLSILFFGGIIKIKVDEPVMDEEGLLIFIKSGDNKGQIKTKKVEKEIYIKGLGLKPLDSWKTKKEGEFQTNKDVLQLISGEEDEQ